MVAFVSGGGMQGIGMTSARTRARMIERLRAEGIRDETVLNAMSAVPRHMFIEEALAHRAYEDTALPIGFGQTISQPFVVARMIELLREGGRELGRTLEVGAGCGYQAAILGMLSREVFAVERIAPLLLRARENLRQLRLNHVRCKHADGMIGLPEAAPFDTIIVAAAGNSVPRALREQLVPGGRLMMPVGGGEEQVLLMVERTACGYSETRFDAVRFVPLLPGTE